MSFRFYFSSHFRLLTFALQYGLAGAIILDYAGLYFVVGVICGVIGQTLIEYLVNKYNKKSIIIWSIVVAIAVSAVFLLVTGGINLEARISRGGSLGFNDICS